MNFFGITFHLYGLIVGISFVVAWFMIEKKAEEKNINFILDWRFVLLVVLGGVIGARFWHFVTDYHLYDQKIVEVLFIWNGGLSILGAILGGVFSLVFLIYFDPLKLFFIELDKFKKNIKNDSFLQSLDLIVFGLPLGQVIGRWANYFNQELYGLPSDLPWAIFINLENRSHDFKSYSTFHPLFLYEGLLMTMFFIWIWRKDKSKKIKKWKVGQGKYFISYLIYYLIIRFFLDFVRIEKGFLWFGLFGINQIIIMMFLICFWMSLFLISLQKD